MEIAFLLYVISAYESFPRDALFPAGGVNLCFQDSHDWLMVECWEQESSLFAVFVGRWFFRLWTVTYLALRAKIKHLYDTFFSLFFSICIHWSLVLLYFQVLVSTNIQGNICFLWHAMHVTVAFFSNWFFFWMLWTSF